MKAIKRNTHSNIELLADYKRNIISKRSEQFENFTKNISLVCHNESEIKSSTFSGATVLPDVSDRAIFMLQTINVGGKNLNVFYDSGCGDIVVKKSAIDSLIKMGRAKLEEPGPITLSGVGDHKSVCEHGIYSFKRGLLRSSDICFSKYPLKDVEKDVRKICKRGWNIIAEYFTKTVQSSRGETDILIGIMYQKYHPKKMWESSTGLSVSVSCFLSEDGTTGVIGGPHAIFTEIDRKQKSAQTGKLEPFPVYSSSLIQYRSAYRSWRDVPLLGFKNDLRDSIDVPSENHLEPSLFSEYQSDYSTDAYLMQRIPRCVKVFDEVERVGTEISYRCVGCRNCQECKRSSRIDSVSIQEEIEQDLINSCVQVDIENHKTTTLFSFITNPDNKLSPTENFALKIYESQIRGLEKKPNDKVAILESEGKLRKLGFVDYLDNLPNEDKDAILSSKVKYFIPWRVVFNESSGSTPCRLVLDASCCPRTGCNLNSF